MNNPSQITIMPQQKTAERVEQSLFHVGREDKFPLLLGSCGARAAIAS